MEGWVEDRTCLKLGKESWKTLMVVYPIANPTPSLASGVRLPSKSQKTPNSLFSQGFLLMGALVTWPSHVPHRPWGKAYWGLLGKSFPPPRRVTWQETTPPLLWPDTFVDILEEGGHLGTMTFLGYQESPRDDRVERWEEFLGDIASWGANPATNHPASRLLVMWITNILSSG